MSFSYSGLTNYGKSSLPSVESWGTNNNILRDPPKSITTRRIDKVADTSFFTQEIQDSSDRIAEVIMAYPRGVNPMVAVSYDNSNGGAGLGQATLYRGQQAKLPYRIMDKGAFRPPILAPVNLLPLSKMPRNTTHINPTIYKPDYSKKLSCTHEARAIKESDKLIKTDASSSIYFKIEKPVELSKSHAVVNSPLIYGASAAVKYQTGKDQRDKYTSLMIKTPLYKNVNSGKKDYCKSIGDLNFAHAPSVTVKKQPFQIACESNKKGNAKYINPSFIERKKYTTLSSSMETGKTKVHAGGTDRREMYTKIDLRPVRRRALTSADTFLSKRFSGGANQHEYNTSIQLGGRKYRTSVDSQLTKRYSGGTNQHEISMQARLKPTQKRALSDIYTPLSKQYSEGCEKIQNQSAVHRRMQARHAILIPDGMNTRYIPS